MSERPYRRPPGPDHGPQRVDSNFLDKTMIPEDVKERLRLAGNSNAEPDAEPEVPKPDGDPDETTPSGMALFHKWTMAEVFAEPDDYRWQVSQLLIGPTYGQLAGEMKTLKSYLATFVNVGLCTGLPIFGQFKPERAQPVLALVGEGGLLLWKRRVKRIAAAMGASEADLGDLYPRFDVAPIDSLLFQDSLLSDLEEFKPGLVSLDPLYAYHGATTRAADLHQEGALLNRLSRPCLDAGASLLVVNHFNQTGTGQGLKRITMAGSAEWSDSWVLVKHREDPDVEAGLFRLSLEIGSRQWGGMTWDLDLDLGRFDVETLSHDGSITWDLSRARSGHAVRADKKEEAAHAVRSNILEVLAEQPFELTKTGVRVALGDMNYPKFKSAWDELVRGGGITQDKRGRTEAGSVKKRERWGLASTQGAPGGPSGQVEID